MNTEKTLVVITPGFPSDELDTTCLPSTQSFVKAVNRNFPFLKIIILTLRYPYRKESYNWHSNLVISLNGNNTFRFSLWIQAYLKLKEIRSQTKLIGILNFWCLEGALIGTFFANRNGLRNLIWIHGQDARKSNRWVKFIKPNGNELVAFSEFLADEFASNHKIRPQHIVPNGVDVTEFPDQKSERTIDVLGVGSLIALKQYSIFIDVIASLAKTNPGIKATLCGAGPELDVLQEKIRALKLETNIDLRGELPHEAILEIMQRSKVLLHPSEYEGYSTVCIEALFAGCHVVSFTKAENRTIENWHIASNASDMISIVSDVLQNTKTFKPVIVHDMNDSARQLISLFD